MDLLLIGLFVAGLLVVGVCIVSTVTVLGVSSSKAKISQEIWKADSSAATRSHHSSYWAAGNGFEWVGSYKLTFPTSFGTSIGAWQKPDGTVLVFYDVALRPPIDIVTFFDGPGDLTLTTSNTSAAMSLPHSPSSLVQSFSIRSIQYLMLCHEESLNAVARVTDRLTDRPDQPIEHLIMEAVRAQVVHIRAIPFWQLRTVWWQATMRFRHNKPITEQQIEDSHRQLIEA